MSRRTPYSIRARLAVRSLEERAVPATLVVNNTADSGPGSLRQALLAAATAGRPGPDSIAFAGGLTGTILLASPLAVTSDVTILGPGANVVAVSGNKSVRVFDVSDGAASTINVTVSGLTVRDGSAATGAGLSVGQNDSLTLRAVWLTG